MTPEIKSAAEATRIATTFLKQYYNFLRPVSAVKENGNWKVRVDVGIVTSKIAKLEVNASTGDVTEYSLP